MTEAGACFEYLWTLVPAEFLEQPLTLESTTYIVSSDAGSVVARIAIQPSDGLRQRIERHIISRLQGDQLISFRSFQLTHVGDRTVLPDGSIAKRHVSGSGHVGLRLGVKGDIRGLGPDGTVVHDAKAERLKLKATLGEKIHQHATNATLRRMLDSYASAIREPQNELIHLYEIKEALHSAKVLGKMKMTKTELDSLTRLANNDPILEGRHRGKHTVLRPATHAELEATRTTARELIARYIAHLSSP